MKKIYVGNAIQGAPAEFLEEMNQLKEMLRCAGFEVMEYIGLDPNTSSKSVYEHDEQCVLTCDVFIAVCTVPSIGLGIEIALANAKQKPTLVCYKQGTKMSRMALGSQVRNPNMKVVMYENFEEILDTLKNM